MERDYVIRRAEKSEVESIVHFLEKHHTPEDVITQGFVSKNKHRMSEEEVQSMEKKFAEFLKKYTCLLAIRESEIVGTVVLYPSDDDKGVSASAEKSGLMDELDRALIRVYEEIGFYRKFGSKRILKLRSLTVHRNYRGRGLAKLLIREGIKWAREREFELVFSLFTTGAAKRAAESVGFVKFIDYDLMTITDTNGDSIFDDIRPDNITSLMIMEPNQ